MSKSSNADPSADDKSSTTAERDDVVAVLTPEQIQRWARLIAEGRGELPAELNAASCELLVEEVRRLLRDRLMRFFAHAIAVDIQRRGSPGEDYSMANGRNPPMVTEVQ